jgi:hypothetical protein
VNEIVTAPLVARVLLQGNERRCSGNEVVTAQLVAPVLLQGDERRCSSPCNRTGATTGAVTT